MRLHVVHANDAREAITRIRADLGDDALVLATRQTESGVSVTAAVGVDGDDDLSTMLLPVDDDDTPKKIDATLAWHGVPSAVRLSILSGPLPLGTTDIAGRLTHLLAQWASFAPLVPAAGNRLVLVGPHGSGKTALAARLAVAAILSGIACRLICADPSRAAAVEQLRALVAPLGKQLEVVQAGTGLEGFHRGDARAWIVDTCGLNPFRGDELARVAEIVLAAGAEPIVVLPAGLAGEDMAEMAANFVALGAKRMVVTRLDGARRLGGLLMAADAGLAFAGGTIAPEIGRPLLPLTAAGLARLLLHRSAATAEG